MKNVLILCCEQYTEGWEETLESLAECEDIDEIDCYAITTYNKDILDAIEPYEALFNNVFVKDDATMEEHKKLVDIFRDVYETIYIYFAGQHVPARVEEIED